MGGKQVGGHKLFFGTNDIARLLSVTPTTIQRWIDSGALSCIRTLGGHRRVSRGDLRSFLESHRLPIPVGLDHRRPRFLVVDDDPAFVKSFRKKLSGAFPNASIDTADNGFQALILVGQLAPDVVFLDHVMSDVDSLEAIRRIKRDPKLKKTRVLAMSARGWGKEKLFRSAGADGFFVKDFDDRKILDLLRKLIPSLKTPKARLS